MRTLINLRYPLFAALSMATGILLSVSIVYGKWFFPAIFAMFFLAVFLFFFLTKGAKRLKKVLLVVVAFVVFGIMVSAINISAMQNRRIGTQDGTLYGTMTDNFQIEETYTRFELRDCYFVSERTGQATELAGKTSVFTFSSPTNPQDQQSNSPFYIYTCEAGNIVKVGCTISDVYLFKDEINAFYYKKDINYTAEHVMSIYSVSGQANFDELSRLYIKHTFETNMPQTVDTALALVLGDRSLMSQEDIQNFQDAGIIHILAVSGLHVGFVVAVFSFVLKLLKVSPKIQLPIILIPLCFYVYICGFAPSLLRATVMTFVVLFSKCLHTRSDLLNSLSIAAVAILIFRPFYIFEVGFLYSFASIFGIATFTAAADRLYRGKKLNFIAKHLLSSLHMTVGATLATLCIGAYFFNRVSLISVFSNIVALPVVSWAYMLCIFGLTPFLGFTLWLPDKLLLFLKQFARFASGIPFSAVAVLGFGIAAVALYLWLFVFGGYVRISRKKVQRILLVGLVVLFVALTVLHVVPNDTSYKVLIGQSHSSLIAMTDDQNVAYVIGDVLHKTDVELVLDFLTLKKVDEMQVFLYNFSSVKFDDFATLFLHFNLTKVYIFDQSGNDNIEGFFDTVSFVRVPKGFPTNGNIQIKSIYDGAMAALYVRLPVFEFAVIISTNQNIINNLPSIIPPTTDFIFAAAMEDQLADVFPNMPIITKVHYDKPNLYSTSQFGNFTFSKRSDIFNLIKLK